MPKNGIDAEIRSFFGMAKWRNLNKNANCFPKNNKMPPKNGDDFAEKTYFSTRKMIFRTKESPEKTDDFPKKKPFGMVKK